MSELEDLARAGAARWVLAVVTLYLRSSDATNGGRPGFPREAERFLGLLRELATGETFGSETPAGTVVDVVGMAPVSAAADAAGCSEQYARTLARSGRVRSFRAGPRCLLVDVDGLKRALRRSA